MGRVIILDTGPLGLAAQRPGLVNADDCRSWLVGLSFTGAEIIVPEIADYEVRRELLRSRTKAGIQRLNGLCKRFTYRPINTRAMRQAARFWAHVRQAGKPTAPDLALDGDAILASQAAAEQRNRRNDLVIIATTNVRHLARFPIDARDWPTIT